MKLICKLIICLIFIISLYGCEHTQDQPNIDDIDFYSDTLEKDMKLKVYTPDEYSDDVKYPVLYFIPDYGGSVYTVMDQYDIAKKAKKLILDGKINPLIIVAVSIERSFGINSSDKVMSFETSSGKRFNKGMYEDYVCKEVIPLIDSKYNTVCEKEGRYIGGYSMGGFAALHISFRNGELFSKAGGHSPSIFTNDFPDKTISDWLYPNDKVRKERDPIHIVQNNNIEDLSVFLDVESGGSEGVKYLYEVLKRNEIDAYYKVLSLSHSRMSCNDNMEEYLLFYSGIENNNK